MIRSGAAVGRARLAAGLWAAASCGAVAAADLAHGAELYRLHCTSCHGPAGRPVLPGAPDLSHPTALLKSDLELMSRIRGGRGGMPAYQGQLRDREILDIVAYLRSLK